MLRALCLVALIVPCALCPAAQAEVVERAAEIQSILAECQAAYRRLEDYRGLLVHEIGEQGESSPRQVIEVTFRKPGFLSLRWQTGLYKGTTLLARPALNQGNLLLRLGEWFDFVTVSMPATDAGDPFVPSLKDVSEWLTALVALAQRPATDRSLRSVELQTADPNLPEGKVLLSIPAFLIPFRDNTVASYDFIVERGTGLPVELVLRGAGGKVRQRMTYTDLQVNVGIPVQAFSWEPGAGEVLLPARMETTVDLRGFTQNWQRRYGEITDYTGVWVVDDRSGGRPLRSQATFKFRKPFDLYLEGGAEGGGTREALFRQGWNDGRVRVRTVLWGIPLIGDLTPDGYLARSGYHLPVTEFGLNRLVERLQDQLLRGWLRGELQVRFLGVQAQEERPCYVLEFTFLNNRVRDYASYRVITYWDIAQRVLVRHEAFDWEGRLSERQEFRHLQLNVSLGDADFDAANPTYGFLLFRHTPRLDRFLTGRE
jgi:outer membrane lipoprotein-sorting protein